MKKFAFILSVIFISVFSTACVNNLAVQELNNKAKVFMDKGDYENAISRLQSSIDLDDTIFETQYNLGVAYTYADKYNEAIDTFNKALELNPNMSVTYYSLGVAQENFAIDIIKGAIKADGTPFSEDELIELAGEKPTLTAEDISKAKNLYQAAIQSYEEYLNKDSKAKDKENVEAKIANIQAELVKLDNPDLLNSNNNAVNYNKTLRVE